MSFSWKRAGLSFAGVVVVLLVGYLSLFIVPPVQRPQELGVQFSKAHATYLGLDWHEAYTKILDDLGVRTLRLAAYWNEVEPSRARYSFEDLDWMLDEAAARQASVILAIGRRLPRWPECHVPDWAKELSEQEQQARLDEYLRATVNRYRHHQALRLWQVENEPFLRVFGECPPPHSENLEREVALVRAVDPSHRILTTDSGELSSWMRAAAIGDVLGTTMYRVVWNPLIGYWSYDALIPPAFYRVKAMLAGKDTSAMIIAELQAEPWIPRGDLLQTSIEEQVRSMDVHRFRRHVAFARATGFPSAYLWGAEYWYWLKTSHGDSTLWDTARALFHGNADNLDDASTSR